jgi:hypothetical protein
MKKTIFNVYVAMDSQETCDRMKAVCLENGLPIWNYKNAFFFQVNDDNYFEYDYDVDFGIFCGINGVRCDNDYTQVTEAEFLELLKEYKLNK